MNGFALNMMPLRVAAYCRVSTGYGEQLGSFDNQVSIYRDKIAKNPNWVLADIYADLAVSGTTDNRPEFQRMIKDAERNQFDLLLVKSISRFARNTLLSVETIRRLHALGVSVIFEKENIDTTKPYSEMMLTVLSAFAQEESRGISERVKKGKRMKEARGEIPWNPLYGYTRIDNRPFVVVEHEAEVVRRVFREYVCGKAPCKIREDLNKEGIPSPSGGLWVKNSINNLLRNERYTGDIMTMKVYCDNHMTHKYKRNQGDVEQYLIADHHAPIIRREVYNYVRDIRKLRRESTYPYGDFLTCPSCGKTLCKMMSGWGCICGQFYLPLSKLNAAMVKGYGLLDGSETPDEMTKKIKERHPTVDTAEYWWLKALIERIAFDPDGKKMTIHWICDEKTEVPTNYLRMRADLHGQKSRALKKEAEQTIQRKKTIKKIRGKAGADKSP